MIFTILISVVFIAELIITVSIIKTLMNFDKKICELNDTVVLLKPEIKDVSVLVKNISEQMKELSFRFAEDFKRQSENLLLKNLLSAFVGFLLLRTNIKFVQKIRRSKVVKTLAKGLSMLEIMV